MNIFTLISYLLGATFNIFLGIFKIILIVILAAVAYFKGYNPWLWGILTLILPWPFPIFTTLLIFYLPKKEPKLPRDIRNHPAFEGKNPVVASMMALCAMIAKADGNVTKEEIQFIKDFITGHFGMSKEAVNEYAEAFNYGKAHPEQYLAFTDIIFGYYRTRKDYVMLIAFLFVGVAMKDGELSEVKMAQTKKIIMALGLNEYEYAALVRAYMQKESFQDGFNNYGYGSAGSQFAGGYQSEASLIKKYTAVLGLSEDATMSEIKKAYRKLVKEYHPDKLAADNVPQDYIAFANQKIREINEAYEYLEKVKGNK